MELNIYETSDESLIDGLMAQKTFLSYGQKIDANFST